MTFDPEVRERWKARSARLLKLGFRHPTRLDTPESEKLDRSNDEPRPIVFPDLVPLRNNIHARVITRREVERKLTKLTRG
jgi:hypothetical protein